MKAYPSNFKDLKLATLPSGTILRMQNGGLVKLTVHRNQGPDRFEGRLKEAMCGYSVGTWYYSGKKYRELYTWPLGMDIVAIEGSTQCDVSF